MKLPYNMLITLGCTILFIVSAEPCAGEDEQKPVILSALPDSSVSPAQLIMSGRNFGSSKPTVTLDSTPLEVVTFTSTIVEALLPPQFRSGSTFWSSSGADTASIRRHLILRWEPQDRKETRATLAHKALQDPLDPPGLRDRRAPTVRAMSFPFPQPPSTYASWLNL
jgi:IPT/TIG domain